MNDFHTFIERILQHEGGYVNDPQDPGGETQWGISKRAYPQLNIRTLTRADAVEIYRRDYWEKMQCPKMPVMLAFQLLDAGINHGRGNAVRMVQRAVSVADDGIIGPVTLDAVARMEPMALVVAFNIERLHLYARLRNFPHFGRGWILRVAGNMLHALKDDPWLGRIPQRSAPEKEGRPCA